MTIENELMITLILARLDDIERHVGLGKYKPVNEAYFNKQRTHGERVEARQRK